MMNAAEVYGTAFSQGLRPESKLTVSEWADRYRLLSQRASAEAGRWRTARTPYLREIMDALSSSSPYERVVFMKGAQIGGTECGNNFVGYVIHHAPGPIMSIQPTVEMAKRNSKQRIDPLIEESPVLRTLVQSPRSRDSGNTILSKEFPGGILVMTGANAAGDVANYQDVLFGKRRRVEHWDNAVKQGQYLARRLSGRPERFENIPYFFSDVFDLSYEFWGDTAGAERTEYRGDLHSTSFSAWWLKGNRVVAAFAMNRPDAEREEASQLQLKQK
jgi:hypothetical protein